MQKLQLTDRFNNLTVSTTLIFNKLIAKLEKCWEYNLTLCYEIINVIVYNIREGLGEEQLFKI